MNTTIQKCSRCGEEHQNVEMNPFTRDVTEDDITVANYWAMCPTLNEPILIYVSENGKIYREPA